MKFFLFGFEVTLAIELIFDGRNFIFNALKICFTSSNLVFELIGFLVEFKDFILGVVLQFINLVLENLYIVPKIIALIFKILDGSLLGLDFILQFGESTFDLLAALL